MYNPNKATTTLFSSSNSSNNATASVFLTDSYHNDPILFSILFSGLKIMNMLLMYTN
jgi:hypothetical protein